jgi:sulfur carrier protein
MQIYLNGVARQIPDQTTMQSLVETLQLGDQHFAIEVNEELVPRSAFEAHRLSPGDRIEVVQAIGGG